MPSLTRDDAERVLRFIGEAESLGGDEPFTGELLGELGQLVRADWVTYCELDRVRRRFLGTVGRPGDNDEDGDDDERIFWDVVCNEHPVCVRHQQGSFTALKVSDFLSPRALYRTRLYDLWFRPAGIDHELNVAIPSPLWHTKTFLFDRGKSRDFTERDRLILDLLQPHFARLWNAARTRRRLKAALAELDGADEHDTRGVIMLGAGAEIEYTSPPAARLVREFFPRSTDDRLPTALSDWVEADDGRALILQVDGRRLTVRRREGALLLEERQDGVRLTAREREVLAWVARGKTNAEIARLLWLAPSTVRKHLENVYAKLGVSTRTAAVASFLGLIDAEAS
jgi:DNA-binding CsgD family transcriptional regulator